MPSENRNSAVDAIKGIMILFIVLHHLLMIPCLHHGYLAVDMFFMIAGYYLANHYYRKGGTAAQYTGKRIKSFYLPYLLSLLLATILDYKRLISFNGFEGFVETFAPYAAFLTLTEELGFIYHWPVVLIGGWFLSVLIISSFLLYGLLEYDDRKAIKIILPLSLILGFTYLFSISSSTDNFSVTGALSIPLLRGFLEMGVGIMLYSILTENQESLNKKKTLVTVLACLASALFFAMIFIKKPLDSYIVILFPLMLSGVLITESPLKRLYDRCPTKILAWLGALSLEIYVIHQPAIHIVHSIFKYLGLPNNPMIKVLSCLVFIILSATSLHSTCRFFGKNRARSVANQ